MFGTLRGEKKDESNEVFTPSKVEGSFDKKRESLNRSSSDSFHVKYVFVSGFVMQAFTNMTEQKTQLQSICELSNHLLYLEPIFSGVAIREELTRFKAQFQKLVLDLFSQLELQVSHELEP